LRNLAQGDARIAFKGWSSTPADAISGVDAVVMPSRWEAFGLVAIEALAAGRPLMTSGIDGLSDHVKGGALNIAADTPREWAAALAKLTEGAAPYPDLSPYRLREMLELAFAQGWNDLVEELCPQTR
jgi:glycosyltransferase involved in cell wall biosynthesis